MDIHESGLAALKGDNVRLLLGDINNRERIGTDLALVCSGTLGMRLHNRAFRELHQE
jgi:hypothetical protein